jgi:hypothetical protein
MKTSLIFTGRVIIWPDIPVSSAIQNIDVGYTEMGHGNSPLISCWVTIKLPQFSESSTWTVAPSELKILIHSARVVVQS